MKNNSKQQERRFLLLYTILFALSAGLVFWYFPAAGKRLVWKGDGLSQHYVALCYYARWGKAVLKSILAGHPSFPTWNMHIGFGSDLFTTLQYYVIGDPFSLPAVFVPQKYMLDFHDAMIFVRLYLAGLCFDRYCRVMGHRDLTGNLCGTLVYVFSTFAMFGVRHPYFLNAMIWFPLLLLGAEYIFRGGRGRLFTAAVFLACISNFYFFYMLVVMTIVYAVWRALRLAGILGGTQGTLSTSEPEKSGRQPIRQVFCWAGKFLARAVLGAAMGACFLLPILLRFVRDPRASEGVKSGLLYALSYYAKLPEAFVSFGTDATLDYWTCLGFGAVGLVGVLLLFLNADEEKTDFRADPEKRSAAGGRAVSVRADSRTGRPFCGGRVFGGGRRHTDLKLAFLFMLLLAALPFAGTVLNGFSYAANRWTWAFAMLAGYITAAMIPALFGLPGKKAAVLAGCLMVYGAVCLCMDASGSSLLEIVLAAGLVCAAAVLGRLSGSRFCRPSAVIMSAVLLVSILGTAALHGYVEFVPGRMNSSLEEYHTDQYIAAMEASDAAGMKTLVGNETFYRYSGRDLANNFSLLHDVSNTQYYWSLSDGSIQQFFTETGQTNGMVHLYDNLDNRTMIDEIAGVQYNIRSDGSLLPYGYEKCGGLHYDNRDLFEEKEDDPLPVFSFSVYQNQYALPFGFTSDSYISRETYASLSIPERQEALMQGIVLEEEDLQALSRQTGQAPSQEDMQSLQAPSQDQEDSAGGDDSSGSGIREAELTFTGQELPCVLRAEEGISVQRSEEDGSVQVTVRDTEKALYLEAEDMEVTAGRETSVLVTGMSYEPLTQTAGESLETTYASTDPVELIVTAKQDGETVSRKKIAYTLEDNPWKTGRTDFQSCCGYSEEPLSQIRLKFSRPGVYIFRELKAIVQPMEAYPAQAQALGECVLRELDLHEPEGSGATSRITGRITVPEEGSRILCLQIPCSDGMTAYVDGEKASLLQAETMFSALVLAPGTHEIEIRYSTPGLLAGACISLAGIFIFLLEGFPRKKRPGRH